MEIERLRKELDVIDNCIRYLLVQRMSIIPLIAEYKINNNLSIFQPEREEEMFGEMILFSKETGLKPDFIREIYKLVISEAVKVQNEVKDTGISRIGVQKVNLDEKQALYQSLQQIKEFNNMMNSVKVNAEKDGIRLKDIITEFYRNNVK